MYRRVESGETEENKRERGAERSTEKKERKMRGRGGVLGERLSKRGLRKACKVGREGERKSPGVGG